MSTSFGLRSAKRPSISSGRRAHSPSSLSSAGTDGDAGERPVGEDEVPVAEHRQLLEPEYAVAERSDGAFGPEEVVEEGSLHPVLVHQQQQFVQLRVADRPAVVAQKFAEDCTVRRCDVLHRRAGEPLDKRDEMIGVQYDNLPGLLTARMFPRRNVSEESDFENGQAKENL